MTRIQPSKEVEMTKLALLFFMAIVMVGCYNPARTNEKSKNSDTSSAELVDIKFDVKGMACSGCENAITLSLGKVDGVYESSASHVDELVVVKYDPAKTGIEEISEAITRVGYQVIGEKKETE